MRTILTVAAIAALVTVAVLPVFAQPARGQGPGMDAGPRQMQGDRARAQRGERGDRGQQTMNRGYVEVTPESKALWEKLGELKVQQHNEQWKMFELLGAEEVDQEAAKAQMQTMRDLNQQIREVTQDLAQYRKPLPFRERGQRDRQGPRRGGQAPGQGADEAPAE
ncbi:MAG: hypothetical protein ACLFWB_11565 [Armatimonadota bacterium]